MEDERDYPLRKELPRPPTALRHPARTRKTIQKIHYEPHEESDNSDASTETLGPRFVRTPLPDNPPTDQEATDTESQASDRIADICQEEIEGPIWAWNNFYLEELYKLLPEIQEENDNDMANPIPTFSGYSSESVITFIKDIGLYVTGKGANDRTEGRILRAALRGSASARFEAAISLTANNGGIDPPTTDVTVAMAYAWLRATFHTPDIQQQLRDQLSSTVQQINQSPQEFYTRICEIIEIAGYDNAVKDQVAETAFMQGLHPEIALQLRSSIIPLTLTQKVEGAHRYWSVRHPGQGIPEYNFGPRTRNYNDQPQYERNQPQYREPRDLIRPANENWGRSRKTRKEEDLDIADLIKKMNDM